MAGARKNLKRRYKKVVTRKKKSTRFFKSGQVNPMVEKQWDQKKTVRENYATLGLAMSMNSVHTVREAVDRSKAAEIVSIADARLAEQQKALRNNRRAQYPMGEDEVRYLQALRRKYADDFTVS